MTLTDELLGTLESFNLIRAQDRAIELALADRRNAKKIFRALWLALFCRGYHGQASILTQDARDVYELEVLCAKGKRGAK